MLARTAQIETVEAYRPLLALLDSVMVTAEDVAKHWRFTTQTLSNMRGAGRGAPFVRLPSGSIRYRVSELLEWELRGHEGPLSLERVELAALATPGLPLETRQRVVEHLRAALAPSSGG